MLVDRFHKEVAQAANHSCVETIMPVLPTSASQARYSRTFHQPRGDKSSSEPALCVPASAGFDTGPKGLPLPALPDLSLNLKNHSAMIDGRPVQRVKLLSDMPTYAEWLEGKIERDAKAAAEQARQDRLEYGAEVADVVAKHFAGKVMVPRSMKLPDKNTITEDQLNKTLSDLEVQLANDKRDLAKVAKDYLENNTTAFSLEIAKLTLETIPYVNIVMAVGEMMYRAVRASQAHTSAETNAQKSSLFADTLITSRMLAIRQSVKDDASKDAKLALAKSSGKLAYQLVVPEAVKLALRPGYIAVETMMGAKGAIEDSAQVIATAIALNVTFGQFRDNASKQLTADEKIAQFEQLWKVIGENPIALPFCWVTEQQFEKLVSNAAKTLIAMGKDDGIVTRCKEAVLSSLAKKSRRADEERGFNGPPLTFQDYFYGYNGATVRAADEPRRKKSQDDRDKELQTMGRFLLECIREASSERLKSDLAMVLLTDVEEVRERKMTSKPAIRSTG